ncbi:aspartate ammonia-lyase [Rhizobium tibeticum]|uniref:Uncharacterized protein n=1 Tax=Rhizobium tibeticum TaxID=501024 RepID=A0A1H8LS30_9HYPH|nr:aspartate ammonia-lyase [Rhizobium tibeticum]SEH89412.1 hypothetical protein RTCCBAU85039_2916 [Rhizobium tibeticum]SEO07937.1 hypothetical protein SAMN05216228_1011123 [Rhizobium tibeticum]
MISFNVRTEHDLIGDLPVPIEAYCRVHTLPATESR